VADGWAWGTLGLLLALLGIRAWVVESGHASLGRTPVKVKVLTGACAVAAVLVTGVVTVDGGARLAWLLLHPAEAQAIEDAEKAAAEAEKAAAEAAQNGITDPAAVPQAPPAGPPGPAPAGQPVPGPAGR
jgi:hypothetical protein